MLFASIFCAVPTVNGETSSPVTAVIFPEGQYSKTAVREMGREAAHILKRSGVALRWRIGAPPQSVAGRLVVVKLIGRCDMDGSPAYLQPGPLGWAQEVDGTVIPFSSLACDNLRGAVEAAPMHGDQPRGNAALGRAMGRVLAHEIVHVVTDSSAHASQGVTQPALTPRELTSGAFEMQPSEVEAVQDGLSRIR
jgi:hypothetical protein